jgi:hypothetical protein
MDRPALPGVLRVGDRVRLDGAVHTVVGLAGAAVRLAAGPGGASVVALAHLLAAGDFELLDSQPAPRLPPFALLDTLPEAVVARARWWERHVVEVETGLPPDAPAGASPTPAYDPARWTLAQRDAAKAAELRAAGQAASPVTVQRMRLRYRAQGLWGLVDQRATRQPRPLGNADPRLIEAITAQLDQETDRSSGTRERLRRRVEATLTATWGHGVVPMPSRATFYRLVGMLAAGRHSFGQATTRRSLANRPERPFTPTVAARPGEQVQLDSTPLDVMAVLDDGVVGRVEVTAAVDVATRTLCAPVLRSVATKAVDAALLLARMLVPEPMRPGWAEALAMAHSLIPHERLLSLDARMQQAAARPVIVPDTIVVDHHKVFVSETFLGACRTLGISVQPAHPHTPTDKSVVERTFESVNTLFCQHVRGYTGANVTMRGARIQQEAVWTIGELQELLDEWVIADWQHRPHDSLRDPYAPGRALSPNEMFAVLVARAGYLPVTLTGEDYLELLPACWRAITDSGVQLDYRTYDCAALNPYRQQPSGVQAKQGRPFADFTWRHARELVQDRGGDSTDETAITVALADLLRRAEAGPTRPATPATDADRRVAARTRAAAATTLRPHLHAVPDNDPAEQGNDAHDEPAEAPATRSVVPFGVFDPFTDGADDYR